MLDPVADLVLAIDIGGTKMAAGVVTPAGEILDHRHTPTPGSSSGDDLFERLSQLVGEVLGGRSVAVCGVGCGGPMTHGGETVSPINIGVWRGFPLRSRLERLLGVPVFVDNDAKALALGEGWLGAARGTRDYLGMVVSTGVGGGIVLDGRLLDGAAGNAGHIGHITVEPDGHPCACGSRGCLEAEASGTAIAAITGAPAAQASAETIERTGTLVGRAVASTANLLDLRLAVVAGSVALGFGDPFFVAAQREIEQRSRLDFSLGTVIVPGGLGSSGPLVGAAAVGLTGLGHDVLAVEASSSGDI